MTRQSTSDKSKTSCHLPSPAGGNTGANASTSAGTTAKTRSRPNSEYVLYARGEPVAVNADGDTGAQASSSANGAKTRSRPNSEYVLYAYGEPVAMSADGDTSYFGTDILGSVRSVTDKYGNVKASYEYDAFGTPYLANLENDVGFGYCGKVYDSATGLYDYGFRDYSPNSARFTTVDPVRDGNNWFAYVVNDPVNYIDPNGLYVQNNTNQWILIKTEDSGFVSLAPGAKYDGTNVTDSPNSNNTPIDSGKIDGIILADGTIFKISDSKKNILGNISLKLTQTEDGILCAYADDKSKRLDELANKFKSPDKDSSNINGDYHLGDPNIKCGGWLPEFENDDVLQNVLKNNTSGKSSYFNKDDFLNLIKSYSELQKMPVTETNLQSSTGTAPMISSYTPYPAALQLFTAVSMTVSQFLESKTTLPENHEQFSLNRCGMNYSGNDTGTSLSNGSYESTKGGCTR